jgi:hypothetical protein
LVTSINVGFWHEIEEKEKEEEDQIQLQCTSKNTYVGSDHKNKKTEYGNLP